MEKVFGDGCYIMSMSRQRAVIGVIVSHLRGVIEQRWLLDDFFRGNRLELGILRPV